MPPATLPKNITAYTRYRKMPDGTPRYDVVVKWNPDGLKGRVYYKSNYSIGANLKIVEGVPADQLGFYGEWTYVGTGVNTIVIPQAVPGDTYRIAVSTANGAGVYTIADNCEYIDLLIAAKTTIPNTPDGFGVTFTDKVTVSWNDVTNTDVDFYEIRNDNSPGKEDSHLLARTNGLSTVISLTKRNGTLYLFAHSTDGKYSSAAVLYYDKALPKKPKQPKLNPNLGGFGIIAEPIPTDCLGMTVYIDGGDGNIISAKTNNDTYGHTCGAGIYDVSIAYYDLFGEGEKSGESRVVVKISISKDMIDDEAVSLAKVDALVKQKLNDGAIAKQDVTTIVSNLGNLMLAKANYSAIAQMTDAINLRVQKGDVINQINVSPTTTTIDGKYLHIKSTTVIDNNVIVSRMLAAKAVTADKLAVTSLSAITANIGILRTKTSGARTEIKDNLIEIFDENNFRVIALGVNV